MYYSLKGTIITMKTAKKILLTLLCAAGIVVNFAILVADGYSKQPWLCLLYTSDAADEL